jgi:hypothetical protein
MSDDRQNTKIPTDNSEHVNSEHVHVNSKTKKLHTVGKITKLVRSKKPEPDFSLKPGTLKTMLENCDILAKKYVYVENAILTDVVDGVYPNKSSALDKLFHYVNRHTLNMHTNELPFNGHIPKGIKNIKDAVDFILMVQKLSTSNNPVMLAKLLHNNQDHVKSVLRINEVFTDTLTEVIKGDNVKEFALLTTYFDLNPFGYTPCDAEADYKERLFSDLDGWIQAYRNHMT